MITTKELADAAREDAKETKLSDYWLGMCNGIIHVDAMVRGVEPDYVSYGGSHHKFPEQYDMDYCHTEPGLPGKH